MKDAIPGESRATCATCAMCRPAGSETPDTGARADPSDPASARDSFLYFEPDAKCCTYVPDLPNFLVGRILDDDSLPPHGRTSLAARLDAGTRVTPWGVGVAVPTALLLRHGRDAFGRSTTLRCPHYVPDLGTCGIRGHTDAVCATYFCKHDRGAVGGAFWEATEALLLVVQRDVARWCVAEIGLRADALEKLLCLDERLDAPALDGRETDSRRRALWGEWYGREREFYRRAGEIAGQLDWADVLRVSGPEVALRADVVSERWRRLSSREIPDRLRPLPHEVIAASRHFVTVSTYRATDPLEISRALYDLLPAFDGRSTPEVLAATARSRGFAPPPEHVRALVDFRLLGEPEGLSPLPRSPESGTSATGR
ncbi:MAG: hypothetical protein KC591_10100 [Gemmatimonadetes bacterium]|nr:hypothetical protein [Gemmatimonadota bacterium]